MYKTQNKKVLENCLHRFTVDTKQHKVSRFSRLEKNHRCSLTFYNPIEQ